MGIYDRDYLREPPGYQAGRLSGWSVTTWLIVSNVAIFLIDRVLLGGVTVAVRTPMGMLPMRPLEALGHFSVFTGIECLQVWRFLTFQFLHANFFHLLFNMLGLYWFGGWIEEYFGRARFLCFYLLCGMGGAVCYCLVQILGILNYPAWTPLVGASAGIFGILVAAAVTDPNAVVSVFMFPIFIPIRMRMRTMAMIMIVMALFYVTTQGNNAGGEAGHLGGAAMGYLLLRFRGWTRLVDWFSPSQTWVRAPAPPAFRPARPRPSSPARDRATLDREVDRILEKIKTSGSESLTVEERATLQEASKIYS